MFVKVEENFGAQQVDKLIDIKFTLILRVEGKHFDTQQMGNGITLSVSISQQKLTLTISIVEFSFYFK